VQITSITSLNGSCMLDQHQVRWDVLRDGTPTLVKGHRRKLPTRKRSESQGVSSTCVALLILGLNLNSGSRHLLRLFLGCFLERCRTLAMAITTPCISTTPCMTKSKTFDRHVICPNRNPKASTAHDHYCKGGKTLESSLAPSASIAGG
jgi:hypothetical protein